MQKSAVMMAAGHASADTCSRPAQRPQQP